MKKILICTALCVMAAGCSKKGTVTFCEGVDAEGNGQKCGTVFTTGDLALLFKAKAPFETDSLTVKIIHINETDKKKSIERQVKVNPDEDAGRTELEMYDEGKFRVTVEKRGVILSEGTLEIIESAQ